MDAAITTEIHLGATGSTMEAAREAAPGHDFLLVTAQTQEKGKGTKGRSWESPKGNLYMTVAIHRSRLPASRLALFPLELGLHLWEETASRLPAGVRGRLHLKWPNDLMVDGRKTGGMLVESAGDHLLAGIGVNLGIAPAVEDGGRPSARLLDLGIPEDAVLDFAEGLFRRIVASLVNSHGYDPEDILLAWQGKVDWDARHLLRDRTGRPAVLPISVNAQGHLCVEHLDGTREWLVSEYLG